MKIAIAFLLLFSAVVLTWAEEEKAEDDPIAFLKANNMPVEEEEPQEDDNVTEEEPLQDEAEVEKRAKAPPKKAVKAKFRFRWIWLYDRLSRQSCRYIRSHRGYCGIKILNYLCPAYCRCRDWLSKQSCAYLKRYYYCKKNHLTRIKCQFTCATCPSKLRVRQRVG